MESNPGGNYQHDENKEECLCWWMEHTQSDTQGAAVLLKYHRNGLDAPPKKTNTSITDSKPCV